MMKVHGVLGKGITHLREIYTRFETESQAHDKNLAFSEYYGLLRFLGDLFGVDMWQFDVLRANRDVVVEE